MKGINGESQIAEAVSRFKAGRIGELEFCESVLAAGLFVPGITERRTNGFEPMYLEPPWGRFAAAFTNQQRADRYVPQAPQLLLMLNGDLLHLIDVECGLVVNPGSVDGVEFGPEVINHLRMRFSSTAE